MPVTITDLKNNARTVDLNYNGLQFSLTYRPGALTPGFGTDDSQTFLVDMLLKLLIAWGVYEDDAYTQMTPITAEMLNSDAIGLPLLRAMFDRIVQDTLVGKTIGATFGGG